MTTKHETYYVPAQSAWPIVGAIGLFLIAFGAGQFCNTIKIRQLWRWIHPICGNCRDLIYACRLV